MSNFNQSLLRASFSLYIFATRTCSPRFDLGTRAAKSLSRSKPKLDITDNVIVIMWHVKFQPLSSSRILFFVYLCTTHMQPTFRPWYSRANQSSSMKGSATRDKINHPVKYNSTQTFISSISGPRSSVHRQRTSQSQA
jgi:hypothetical protein